MNFFVEHLRENIMALMVTAVTLIALFKVTSFILRVFIAIALIAFLYYMVMTYGPVMNIAPGETIQMKM